MFIWLTNRGSGRAKTADTEFEVICCRCTLPLGSLNLGYDFPSLLAEVWSQAGSRNLLPRVMEQIDIARISVIQSELINHLVEESLSQRFRFVERLIRECRSGLNCFDQPGEVLLTASVQGTVVGIGGLNRDPYFNAPNNGRLRHLYVESVWQSCGIGQLLVTQLIHEANQHYQLLILRTDTPAADTFYQKLGFKTHPSWEHTTHYLQLGKTAYYPLSLL